MKLMPWRSKEKNESRDLTTQSRWDGLDFQKAIDRFFSDPWGLENGDPFGVRSWAPPVDVTENGKHVVVRSEIPGVDPKDLSITVSGDILTLSGEKSESSEKKGENYYRSERRFGSFQRSIQLPASVNQDKVKAEYHNGVLTISLEKTENGAVKRIPVSLKK